MRDEIAKEKRSKFIGKWPSSATDPSSLLSLAQTMVPPELLNNFAVLLMEANKHTEAKKVLEEAVKNCEQL